MINVILNKENEEYEMTEAEFLELVNNELKEFVPKIKEYAKDNSKQDCYFKTEEWWKNYLISSNTEIELDRIIREELFVTV